MSNIKEEVPPGFVLIDTPEKWEALAAGIRRAVASWEAGMAERWAAKAYPTPVTAPKEPRPVQVLTSDCTSEHCPAQWEGDFADGRGFYARYRYGEFFVSMGASREEALTRCCNDQIDLHLEPGGPEGSMLEEEFRHLTNLHLAWDWSAVAGAPPNA